MEFTRVKISTTVPKEDADKLREAVGRAGAGIVGDYSFCSFSYTGQGRFIPSKDANPTIGEANKLEIVEEERIEVECERTMAKKVVEALKQAHPYEEVIVDVVPLLDIDQL
jgi:hypothetical protein